MQPSVGDVVRAALGAVEALPTDRGRLHSGWVDRAARLALIEGARCLREAARAVRAVEHGSSTGLAVEDAVAHRSAELSRVLALQVALSQVLVRREAVSRRYRRALSVAEAAAQAREDATAAYSEHRAARSQVLCAALLTAPDATGIPRDLLERAAAFRVQATLDAMGASPTAAAAVLAPLWRAASRLQAGGLPLSANTTRQAVLDDSSNSSSGSVGAGSSSGVSLVAQLFTDAESVSAAVVMVPVDAITGRLSAPVSIDCSIVGVDKSLTGSPWATAIAAALGVDEAALLAPPTSPRLRAARIESIMQTLLDRQACSVAAGLDLFATDEAVMELLPDSDTGSAHAWPIRPSLYRAVPAVSIASWMARTPQAVVRARDTLPRHPWQSMDAGMRQLRNVSSAVESTIASASASPVPLTCEAELDYDISVTGVIAVATINPAVSVDTLIARALEVGSVTSTAAGDWQLSAVPPLVNAGCAPPRVGSDSLAARWIIQWSESDAVLDHPVRRKRGRSADSTELTMDVDVRSSATGRALVLQHIRSAGSHTPCTAALAGATAASHLRQVAQRLAPSVIISQLMSSALQGSEALWTAEWPRPAALAESQKLTANCWMEVCSSCAARVFVAAQRRLGGGAVIVCIHVECGSPVLWDVQVRTTGALADVSLLDPTSESWKSAWETATLASDESVDLVARCARDSLALPLVVAHAVCACAHML